MSASAQPSVRQYRQDLQPAISDMRQVAEKLAARLTLRRVRGGAESDAEDRVWMMVARELVRYSREDIDGCEPSAETLGHYLALRRAAGLLEQATELKPSAEWKLRAARRQLEVAERLLPGL